LIELARRERMDALAARWLPPIGQRWYPSTALDDLLEIEEEGKINESGAP
jgi:hypothetical protein